MVPAVITLLRGINVGSAHRIKMDALRAVYESEGYRNPVTHLQSGNVVVLVPSIGLASLSDRLETAIERAFGFRPRVIARTSTEFREVIARNPFAGRAGIDPAKFLVTFLAGSPAPESRKKLQTVESNPEEIHLLGREIYVYYPNGLARPRVPWTSLEKILKTPGTARNWNTVTKLLELADQLDG